VDPSPEFQSDLRHWSQAVAGRSTMRPIASSLVAASHPPIQVMQTCERRRCYAATHVTAAAHLSSSLASHLHRRYNLQHFSVQPDRPLQDVTLKRSPSFLNSTQLHRQTMNSSKRAKLSDIFCQNTVFISNTRVCWTDSHLQQA